MKKSSDRSTAVEFLKTITELRRELSAANARIKALEENHLFVSNQWADALKRADTAESRATAAEASDAMKLRSEHGPANKRIC